MFHTVETDTNLGVTCSVVGVTLKKSNILHPSATLGVFTATAIQTGSNHFVLLRAFSLQKLNKAATVGSSIRVAGQVHEGGNITKMG